MGYRFHEVRKGECERVIAFAAGHGCAVQAEALRHHLSLVVESGDATVAAALCVEREPGQHVIEIVVGEDEPSEALLTELADRCLRKVQAEAIGSARLQSPDGGPTQAIWSHANWLERVKETPPPGLERQAEQEVAPEDPTQTTAEQETPAEQAASVEEKKPVAAVASNAEEVSEEQDSPTEEDTPVTEDAAVQTDAGVEEDASAHAA